MPTDTPGRMTLNQNRAAREWEGSTVSGPSHFENGPRTWLYRCCGQRSAAHLPLFVERTFLHCGWLRLHRRLHSTVAIVAIVAIGGGLTC